MVIFLLILLLQLKKRLQVLTLGIGGVGLVSAYVSYSPEIAARYVQFRVVSLINMKSKVPIIVPLVSVSPGLSFSYSH